MSRIGQTCVVASHPRAEDYPLRAAIITADHGDGTVDVTVLNPYSSGQASVRESSMPVMQAMGPIPVRRVNEKSPADYRGRWVAVVDEPAKFLISPATLAGLLTQDEKKALEDAPPGAVVAVGKPNSGTKAKR